MSAKQLVKRGRCKLQAPKKGGNFGTKLTHLCGFWLDVLFFLRVQNIVLSSDWLKLICVKSVILYVRVCVHVWMGVVYYIDLKPLPQMESWLRLQIIHSLK